MKKPSNRDWAIAVVIFVCATAIGFALAKITTKPTIINVENPVNIQLKKSNDSLESVVYYKDSLLKVSEKAQAKSDSIIINNSRTLRNDYETIKNFSTSRRIRYIDSVLRTVGVRR